MATKTTTRAARGAGKPTRDVQFNMRYTEEEQAAWRATTEKLGLSSVAEAVRMAMKNLEHQAARAAR